MRKLFLVVLLDLLLLTVSFYLFIGIKFGNLFPNHNVNIAFGFFVSIWMVLAVLTKKYNVVKESRTGNVLSILAVSDFIALIANIILIRYFSYFIEIRFVILFSILLVSLLEFLCALVFVSYQKVKSRPFYEGQPVNDLARMGGMPDVLPSVHAFKEEIEEHYVPSRELIKMIVEETSESTFSFIQNYLLAKGKNNLIISTSTVFNILNQSQIHYNLIINLKRINDFQFINKFFEAVNSKLPDGGIFIDWVETYELRKKRILSKFPGGINYCIYTIDFLFKRVFPKLPITKKIYFFITKGRNRVLSKAETFGRLYSCGFEILDEQLIENRLFFVVEKVKSPAFDDHPTYGPLIRLKRIGKGGKFIDVYKFRTMHAYSEYLQGYVYLQNDLQEGGKFRDDFRITTVGRIFRKLWIDELPMLINMIKGELKLVGVRPLSQHYFNLYSQEMQEKRMKHKPGLIPPFYADLPKTLDEIMESEKRYLDSFEKQPFLTDVRYFFKAMINILFKHARSK
jgi:lipopolysaccharide/colanic/teichoic acid biosynthesis glycosyltransferase